MLKPGSSARQLASPYVRSAVAALVFGSVVAITLLPEVAEFLSSPTIVFFTLAAVGVAGAVWVLTRVRRYRTNRALATMAADERWDAFAEIGRLEEMHELPAYEPNRSTYTRKSALS